MTWRYGRWTVEHALPFGTTDHLAPGDRVEAGDVIARGARLGTPVRVACARAVGIEPQDLDAVLRVRVGSEVRRGALLVRTGRRFARAVTSPIDGLVVHRTAGGDVVIAPVLRRWEVRSTLDGNVTAADDASVAVEGEAWCLAGLAGYGPDAIGELALAVDAPVDDLAPLRIDVRSRGRILVGGSRVAAEAIARAYACGIAACVAGAVPAGGLRVVYGDDVGASGSATREDRPTVLCLIGFGAAPLPDEIFRPFVAFAGARAAIHTASARLFVFAPDDDGVAAGAPALALAAEHDAITPLAGALELLGERTFPSEVVADAVASVGGPVPIANVLPLDARR